MASIIEPAEHVEERSKQIGTRLPGLGRALVKASTDVEPYPLTGRVRKVVGTLIHAVVPKVEIGEIAELYTRSTGRRLMAEVVGFHDDEALLSPIGELYGVGPDTEVRPTGHVQTVAVGEGLLGRVLDGMGNFIDGVDQEFVPETHYPVNQDPPDPMQRQIIDKPLPMGVRAIDGMLTTGEGQRMGIFASAGGGKSTLMAMLVKGAAVDVTVLALIGERGREVREFIEHDLGPEGMKKSVVVVATSDKSSLERSKAAFVATSIAEYFRDQGKRVLLLMDSVTRFARAQREIGLAVGEPPTRRGFPPSVFATLPRLMERAGMNDKGSITAFYTVLMEGDDMNEPVSDETRSILDGHIVLSRKLAAANHYPAIDILNSKSRVMTAVTSPEHREMSGKVNSLLAKYEEVELLVQIGEYQKGADSEADLAIAKNKPIKEFLQQRTDEFDGFDVALGKLKSTVA
ncbi:ATP synthase yscN (Yop proteins secretion ATPase) [Pseudovibrio sp. FO-BEG1]|uniref:type III secretion system ATPase SctN n=1 Tax=Pseudovibrio TaxID=258255 RepID=UPI000186C275|nr:MULTISPECIES: type III secretion system ATPase SctN [Pseudovibrio]AEV38191.1 ATP synthase yscN (Yop proteins secretion ATPase) [Pseudovibrio sp. FO-BEG1]EEA96200.1 type III secretion apparatus H+-transporting two-sector ATPase [Pseudovibrio sp. JE062]